MPERRTDSSHEDESAPDLVEKIDLTDHRDRESKIFSGRPRGERVRHAVRLSELETKGYSFEIHVPENTYSLTSSFFLGMFRDSIRSLGEDKFRERFRFTGKDIRRVIDDGIRESLKRASPLDFGV